MEPDDSTFLSRVQIRNYKSIGNCDVELGPLTFLVGPNGSGKSNFVDALRFVADALRTTLDHAIRDRGGINEVRRRSTGHPTHFQIGLTLRLRSGGRALYEFRVKSDPTRGGFEVQHEQLNVWDPSGNEPEAHFRIEGGQVLRSNPAGLPPGAKESLYLPLAAGLPIFRGPYLELIRMGFYNLNPDRIRDLQSPDPGALLARDGSNLASVVGRMRDTSPERLERVEELLAKVVPGVEGVDRRILGPKEMLEFRQFVPGSARSWRFPGSSMSDGTLRALGILVALFQSTNGPGGRPSLIAIEEPETALHPGASGVLLDGLRAASLTTQVVVTSHGADLLDNPDIVPANLLAVVSDRGTTHIGPITEHGRNVMRDRLFTAGELLRMEQLLPHTAQLSFGTGE
ncbi:MAG: AAA family ATPase [Dehalococcoidia bacterium]